MKETGRMGKRMDMEYIIILMGLDMKEIGWMICRYELKKNIM